MKLNFKTCSTIFFTIFIKAVYFNHFNRISSLLTCFLDRNSYVSTNIDIFKGGHLRHNFYRLQLSKQIPHILLKIQYDPCPKKSILSLRKPLHFLLSDHHYRSIMAYLLVQYTLGHEVV